MTNRELNEAIARLMGWTKGDRYWNSPDGFAYRNTLPDLLAPDRIHELMDLAKKFTNDLAIHWVKTSGNEARCGFTGKWYSGDTPAEALARAIIAHKKTPAP